MAAYKTKRGDTLWGISKKMLGSGSRWKELGYQGDPRRLQVGTTLKWGAPAKAQAKPSAALPAPPPRPGAGTRELPAPPPRPEPSLAERYAAPGVEAAPKAPPFSKVMPFYGAWERLQPQAESAALQQINPELMRQHGQANRQYMQGMASSGGGRFGRGWGGVGGLKAEAERQRKGMLQDYLGAYREGFQKLFYDPSEQAWTRAMTQGTAGEMPTVPTWDEFSKQYGTMYGAPKQESSPFIGTGQKSLYG